MKLMKVKKSKPKKSCYTCGDLGSRQYMTSPYSGGVEYWCRDGGKDLDSPKETICKNWSKDEDE